MYVNEKPNIWAQRGIILWMDLYSTETGLHYWREVGKKEAKKMQSHSWTIKNIANDKWATTCDDSAVPELW